MRNLNGRPLGIDLNARLNREMFLRALEDIRKGYKNGSLSEYDQDFFVDMDSAWNLVGADFKPTVKQFNYMKQLAADLVRVGY